MLCVKVEKNMHGISSGVTGGGGGRVPPETSVREIFADVSGKERQGKKGKRGEN